MSEAINNDRGDWDRVPRAGQTLRGLPRSTIQYLCYSNKIKSITLDRVGKGKSKSNRGIRLIYLPSLDEYLATKLREQCP